MGSSLSLSRPQPPEGIDLIGESTTQAGTYPDLQATLSGNSVVNSDNSGAFTQAYFVLGSDNTDLPLVLSPLNAVLKGDGVLVTWTTFSESGINSFGLEKSTDGKNFFKLATLAPTGSQVVGASYSWLDTDPAPGDNFYRLEVLSQDGGVQFSNIAKAVSGSVSGSITIFPDPVGENGLTLRFMNLKQGNYKVTVTNLIGQPVLSGNLAHPGGSAVYTIPLGKSLPSGVYELQVYDGKTRINELIEIN